mmetsp:Transcript_15162/g.57639  ORF Transcript_15162/g.57639 Transcript_15162/m.57639 type:complete len:1477 (+) Transcript_15162:3397-7827(+)
MLKGARGPPLPARGPFLRITILRALRVLDHLLHLLDAADHACSVVRDHFVHHQQVQVLRIKRQLRQGQILSDVHPRPVVVEALRSPAALFLLVDEKGWALLKILRPQAQAHQEVVLLDPDHDGLQHCIHRRGRGILVAEVSERDGPEDTGVQLDSDIPAVPIDFDHTARANAAGVKAAHRLAGEGLEDVRGARPAIRLARVQKREAELIQGHLQLVADVHIVLALQQVCEGLLILLVVLAGNDDHLSKELVIGEPLLTYPAPGLLIARGEGDVLRQHQLQLLVAVRHHSGDYGLRCQAIRYVGVQTIGVCGLSVGRLAHAEDPIVLYVHFVVDPRGVQRMELGRLGVVISKSQLQRVGVHNAQEADALRVHQVVHEPVLENFGSLHEAAAALKDGAAERRGLAYTQTRHKREGAEQMLPLDASVDVHAHVRDAVLQNHVVLLRQRLRGEHPLELVEVQRQDLLTKVFASGVEYVEHGAELDQGILNVPGRSKGHARTPREILRLSIGARRVRKDLVGSDRLEQNLAAVVLVCRGARPEVIVVDVVAVMLLLLRPAVLDLLRGLLDRLREEPLQPPSPKSAEGAHHRHVRHVVPNELLQQHLGPQRSVRVLERLLDGAVSVDDHHLIQVPILLADTSRQDGVSRRPRLEYSVAFLQIVPRDVRPSQGNVAQLLAGRLHHVLLPFLRQFAAELSLQIRDEMLPHAAPRDPLPDLVVLPPDLLLVLVLRAGICPKVLHQIERQESLLDGIHERREIRDCTLHHLAGLLILNVVHLLRTMNGVGDELLALERENAKEELPVKPVRAAKELLHWLLRDRLVSVRGVTQLRDVLPPTLRHAGTDAGVAAKHPASPSADRRLGAQLQRRHDNHAFDHVLRGAEVLADVFTELHVALLRWAGADPLVSDLSRHLHRLEPRTDHDGGRTEAHQGIAQSSLDAAAMCVPVDPPSAAVAERRRAESSPKREELVDVLELFFRPRGPDERLGSLQIPLLNQRYLLSEDALLLVTDREHVRDFEELGSFHFLELEPPKGEPFPLLVQVKDLPQMLAIQGGVEEVLPVVPYEVDLVILLDELKSLLDRDNRCRLLLHLVPPRGAEVLQLLEDPLRLLAPLMVPVHRHDLPPPFKARLQALGNVLLAKLVVLLQQEVLGKLRRLVVLPQVSLRPTAFLHHGRAVLPLVILRIQHALAIVPGEELIPQDAAEHVLRFVQLLLRRALLTAEPQGRSTRSLSLRPVGLPTFIVVVIDDEIVFAIVVHRLAHGSVRFRRRLVVIPVEDLVPQIVDVAGPNGRSRRGVVRLLPSMSLRERALLGVLLQKLQVVLVHCRTPAFPLEAVEAPPLKLRVAVAIPIASVVVILVLHVGADHEAVLLVFVLPFLVFVRFFAGIAIIVFILGFVVYEAADVGSLLRRLGGRLPLVFARSGRRWRLGFGVFCSIPGILRCVPVIFVQVLGISRSIRIVQPEVIIVLVRLLLVSASICVVHCVV